MDVFWKIAVGATGIAGVGAFVLWSLYKNWLNLPILAGLTSRQKFSLFRLFLVLTSVFALATLSLSAFRSSLDVTKREESASELSATLESRYTNGEKVLKELASLPDLPEVQKQEVEKLQTKYSELGQQAIGAVDNGQELLFHEKSKAIIRLLESQEAKKAIPEETRMKMVTENCSSPYSSKSSTKGEEWKDAVTDRSTDGHKKP